MAIPSSPQKSPAMVRIGGKLSEAFDRVQEQIRERAYHIFRSRDPEAGDSRSDWLNAQMQVVTPVELVLKDQKKSFIVEAQLEGFSPKEIEIDVGNGELRVFGSHTESNTKKESGVTEQSTRTSYFYQALPLPSEVELDKCGAKLFKNGKLSITLPKKTASPKQ